MLISRLTNVKLEPKVSVDVNGVTRLERDGKGEDV